MDHEDYKAMLPLQALSTLETADARALDEHLATCADCRAESTSWQETAGALALIAPPLEPSSQVRDRILASVHADNRDSRPNVAPISRARPRATSKRGASPNFLAIAAAVIFLALGIGLVVLWQQNRSAQSEIARLSQQVSKAREELEREHTALAFFARPGTRMSELAGTKDAPSAHAMLAMDSNGRAVLMAQGLPQAPAGKAYQLWFIAGNKPMPGKVFKTDADGNAMIDEQMSAEALKASVFAVTLEPQGGVSAPTGSMFLLSPALKTS